MAPNLPKPLGSGYRLNDFYTGRDVYGLNTRLVLESGSKIREPVAWEIDIKKKGGGWKMHITRVI